MLSDQLTSIASKLLSSEHTKLEDLSVEEQNFWKSFDNSAIYEFIIGEPDCLPEFQFDWIEPCQLAAHLPPGLVLAQPHNQQPPPDQIKPPAQPSVEPAQPPVQPTQPQVLPPAPPLPVQDQPLPETQPSAGPSGQQMQQSPHQHDLCPRPEINYKELHTGVKSKSIWRKAKAVVTKLAPGSFSLKLPPTEPPPYTDNPGPSS